MSQRVSAQPLLKSCNQGEYNVPGLGFACGGDRVGATNQLLIG